MAEIVPLELAPASVGSAAPEKALINTRIETSGSVTRRRTGRKDMRRFPVIEASVDR